MDTAHWSSENLIEILNDTLEIIKRQGRGEINGETAAILAQKQQSKLNSLQNWIDSEARHYSG